MDKKTPIIIITGYPGTGKTCLAHHLSENFSVPLVSKDEIKEIMFGSLGWSNVDWSKKLGDASYKLMLYFSEKLLYFARPFILETYFTADSEKELNKLVKKYDLLPLQIVCNSKPELIMQRVKNRAESGERHPGHVDNYRSQELEEKLKSPYLPLKIGGKILVVEMSDFEMINYSEIYNFIDQYLKTNHEEISNYLNRVIDFVDVSFGVKKPHYVRALFWVENLKPDADLALKIAAYSHDVERAFNQDSGRKRLLYQEKTDLTKHQHDSAQIIGDFLEKQKANKIIIKKVKELISRHEIGGNAEQNILKDADSISYLENNAVRNLEWLGEVPTEEIRSKFDWMYSRISSKKAKEIAKPFYEKAVRLLQSRIDDPNHKSCSRQKK